MFKHSKAIAFLAVCVLLLAQFNCATILDGSKSPSERTADIQWGYFVLDVLIGGGVIGLIVDFSTGAIYQRAGGSRSEIENRLREYSKNGAPCYRVDIDGIYKVDFDDGKRVEVRIEEHSVPPVVLRAIEKQKQALTSSR